MSSVATPVPAAAPEAIPKTRFAPRPESADPAEKNLEVLKDVCLGFCYDPLAGLARIIHEETESSC